jgi:hypothetical protein
MHGHLAGCAIREVRSFRRVPQGTIVLLECGHEHFTGKYLNDPTRRECLESPCYKPIREFAA